MKKILPILFISLSFSSCIQQEAIEPQHYDYIGLWESDVWVIEIFQNGGARFNSNRRRDPNNILGSVRFKNDRLIIWGDGGRCALDIDIPPTDAFDQVNQFEYTFMVLEDVELIRVR